MIGRQVPAWGYAERADDLLVRHGLMWREIVVVPYGRMQYVDVQAGPGRPRLRDRPGAAAHRLGGHRRPDPGAGGDEAARLRDRLASRGQARLAGL